MCLKELKGFPPSDKSILVLEEILKAVESYHIVQYREDILPLNIA